MEHEAYYCWKSDTPFEEILLKIERDIESFKKDFGNLSLITFGINNQTKPDLRNMIEDLISENGTYSSKLMYSLRAGRLCTGIEFIVEKLLICPSESEFELLLERIEKVVRVIEMLHYLLKGFYEGDSGQLINFEVNELKRSIYRSLSPSRSRDLKKERVSPLLNNLASIDDSLNKLKSFHYERLTPNIIYIPVLRTSRTLSGITDDIFEKTIRNQMPSLSTRVLIHTGLSLNAKILKSRNGSKQDFYDFLAFEEFIGGTFFDGREINMIAQYGEDKEIRISLPDERTDVSFNDLGDGVSGIINLLYPIFTAPKDSWVFIEEPENNLHPAYQLIFVKAISENVFIKEKNLKIFINTHSNHILVNSYLSPEDINVIVFSKRDKDTTSLMSFSDDKKSTLDLLGVLNTSVLVSNCLIWVEGVTDRLYVQAFLKAYIDSLDSACGANIREGLDYCFIEYGGKNLVHYDFKTLESDGIDRNVKAFYSNNRILVLADHDNDEAKKEQFSAIENKHFEYIDTGLPEIENILPKEVLIDFLRHLAVTEKLINNVDFKLIATKKLGELFDGVKKNRRKLAIKAKHGGTLSNPYKRKLSEFVFQKVAEGSYDWNLFRKSHNIERVIEKIFSFIKLSNGG
ncbi:AAA family ATPase [Sphingobacterium phlebotomi]|nr:AAA family ATPase [Sphingobacterium phlebotomi]